MTSMVVKNFDKIKNKEKAKKAPTIAVWLSIASKLPENSPKSFVELQSQLDCERNRPKVLFV